jgi:hypothetical protein
MPPEGMVHALEMAYALLIPEGCLVDIHPTGEAPPLELQDRGLRIPLGRVIEDDGYVEYAQADVALAQALQFGWYIQETHGVFNLITRASSISEMREYLARTWTSARISPEIDSWAAAQTELLLQTDPQAVPEIVLTEPVHISRLRIVPGKRL